MKGNKTILGSILVISLVSIILAGSYTGAFFSDTETSTGNTFSSGSLNLQVGDNDPVTWKLDENVMPGDSDGENISVENTGTIDGFLHINFTNLLNKDVTCTEPENNSNDPECNTTGIPGAGELAENLFITVYFDNDNSGDFSNGDTLIYQGIVNNTTTSLLQAKLVDSELLSGNKENFRIDRKIDGSVGNEVQSDSVQFDIPFELTQKPKTVMNGLVGYWTFNEKGNIAYDYSGNGNNGTIYGASLTNGKSGGALSFDGVDDYVRVPDDDVFDMDDYTIEMWVYNEAGDDLWPTLINRHSQSGTAGFWWSYTTGADESQINFQYTNGSGHYYVVSWSGTLPKDNWTQIDFVFDKSAEEVTLFINGVSQGTKSTPGALPVTSGDIYFGEYQGSSSNRYSFLGNLDEIRIYNRVLTPAEIQQNFEAGR